jgi:hypothetical protein
MHDIGGFFLCYYVPEYEPSPMHQRTNIDASSVHGTTQCLTPFLCIQRSHLRPDPCSSCHGVSFEFPASMTELKLT